MTGNNINRYLINDAAISGWKLLAHQKLTIFSLLESMHWRAHYMLPYTYSDGGWQKRGKVQMSKQSLDILTAVEGILSSIDKDCVSEWDIAKARSNTGA